MATGISASTFLLIASYPDSIVSFRGALITSLLSSGWSVHIAAPGLPKNSSARKCLEVLGARVHDIPFRRTGTDPLADLRLLVRLYRLHRDVKPVATLAYTIKPVIYGMLAGWLAGTPRRYALITGLGYAFTGSRKGLLTGLIRYLYRIALMCANKVIFQNPDDRDLFHAVGILAARKPTVVVNGSGVDLSEYEAQIVPQGPPVFLMIGRLLGDKGVREYAQAAKCVRALHSEVRFGLVGWIDENPDAVSQGELDAWVSDGTILFHGKRADVRPCIAACSVYVLPSYREGTPRTVLEAMAMGRAVITTDAPGCRETVIHGDNGYLVSVQSIDALVKAMLRFVRDPSLAQQMGRRSREIAEGKYDVRKVNAVMLREMEILAAPKSGISAA